MKIRTEDELLTLIAEERIWRLREISHIKQSCTAPRAGKVEKEAQRRALIPMAYAHWEGFVKATGQGYLDYVASQKLRLGELSSCFQSVYFSIELASELRKEKRHRALGLIRKLENDSMNRIHIKTKGVISTQDNLNSDALRDICLNLGLDFGAFGLHEAFLDKVLLAKRNCIAHGEYTPVTAESVDEVCHKVFECIDAFRTLVENAIANRAYRKVQAS
jgi:hypothetical protein